MGVRGDVKNLFEADLSNECTNDTNSALITNKQGKVNLLHFQIEPAATTLWSDALQRKNWIKLNDQVGLGGTV